MAREALPKEIPKMAQELPPAELPATPQIPSAEISPPKLSSLSSWRVILFAFIFLLLSLSLESEFFDESRVLTGVGGAQIVQQFFALGYHAQKTAPRMIVLAVGFEVSGETGDFLGQYANLHRAGARVFVMRTQLFYDFRFVFGGKRHEAIISQSGFPRNGRTLFGYEIYVYLGN